MPKLTKRFIESLSPSTKKAFHWDDTLKGFGLCVLPPTRKHPEGRKSWVVQYRVRASRRSRRVVLGSASVLTPTQARDEALDALNAAANGTDPAPKEVVPEPAESEVPTLRSFTSRYMTEHAERTKKPRSCTQDQYLLDRFILPTLGDHRIEEISRQDVARLHQKIGAKTPYQANRVLALLSVMFTKAIQWELLPVDHRKPTASITCFREQKRRRFLHVEELTRMGQVLNHLETETQNWKNAEVATARLDSIALIRLYVLTGCRKSELTKLCWDEVDRRQRVLRLNDSKTGPKMVELPTQALKILEQLRDRHKLTDSPYVFPGRDPSAPRHEARRLWDTVRKKAKLKGVRLHDLRRTYASLAANTNVPPSVLQGLLGHAKYETTQGYVQLFDRTRAASAERVGDLAAALLEGRGGEQL